MFTLPTQPMTLSDAIKNTFKLWWVTLASVLPLSISAAILNFLPIFLRPYLMETHTILFFAAFMLIFIINLIPVIAIFAKLGHAAHNQPITLSQALAVSLVKFFPALAWMLICLAFMLVFGGILYLLSSHLAIFALSGLIFFLMMTILVVYLLCVMPIIIFENLSVIPAIQKSFALTKNHWWYGGWLLTVVVIFGAFFSALGQLLMGSLNAESLGAVIVYCFTLPLQTSMIIIFYEHLKLKAEKIR